MSDVPEQTCSPRATCDMPNKHHLYASDAMTDGDVTKEACVNYEQIIREAVRSAGHDSALKLSLCPESPMQNPCPGRPGETGQTRRMDAWSYPSC